MATKKRTFRDRDLPPAVVVSFPHSQSFAKRAKRPVDQEEATKENVLETHDVTALDMKDSSEKIRHFALEEATSKAVKHVKSGNDIKTAQLIDQETSTAAAEEKMRITRLQEEAIRLETELFDKTAHVIRLQAALRKESEKNLQLLDEVAALGAKNQKLEGSLIYFHSMYRIVSGASVGSTVNQCSKHL
eukprot:CAMPEP_0196666252 /NCGR_PEP_ID=MMETSP1086-20130531/64406_1 /TAXON_ID=77921 /ORGANISM="Cyanoptyche  gloeocystis , Strain SAG4.97" /LENGTH=188 /DNA_ID=CAMNT_0042003419 /DNA_START=32 /DNA_END=598 /DNA_ORIENTATION=+